MIITCPTRLILLSLIDLTIVYRVQNVFQIQSCSLSRDTFKDTQFLHNLKKKIE